MENSVIITDPLSEVTRKERRALLVVSAVGIIISVTGLIPTKITALGIEFAPNEQNTILWVVVGLIVYFLVGFIVYAITDYSNWKSELNKWLVHTQPPIPQNQDSEYIKEMSTEKLRFFYESGDIDGATQYENELIHEKVRHELETQYRKSLEDIPSASRKRVYFEFLLPILVAIAAIAVLAFTNLTAPHNIKTHKASSIQNIDKQRSEKTVEPNPQLNKDAAKNAVPVN